MSSNEIKTDRPITPEDNISFYKKAVKSYQQDLEGISFSKMLNEQLSFAQLNILTDMPNSIDEPQKKINDKLKEESSYTNSEIPPLLSVIAENIDSLRVNTSKDADSEREFSDKYFKIDKNEITQDDIQAINNLSNPQVLPLHIQQLNDFNRNLSANASNDISYKSIKFSSRLSELLEKAYKKNIPVRIDLENNVSVILRVDKDGKLSAQFLASDKAMENLIKDNLYQLRAKMDKEGIDYKDLVFKEYKNKDDNKDQSNSNNKEK